MSDLSINEYLSIPSAEMSMSYSRAGGPGGQHVNTAETRVQLRFQLEDSQVLHPAVKRRIRKNFPSLVTQDGELLITASSQRSRHQNIEEARERLADIVRSNLKPPKRRRKTRPTLASKRRRLKAKKKRGEKKKLRGRVRRRD